MFFRLASKAFPDIGSVGRIEKKKAKKKPLKSRNRRSVNPGGRQKLTFTLFGLTKYIVYCKKCSCFCSCFSLCCYYAHFSD